MRGRLRVRGVMWPHCMPSCLHTWLRQYLFVPLPCHVHSSVLPQLTHAVGVVALPLADDIAVLLSACEAASSCWVSRRLRSSSSRRCTLAFVAPGSRRWHGGAQTHEPC